MSPRSQLSLLHPENVRVSASSQSPDNTDNTAHDNNSNPRRAQNDHLYPRTAQNDHSDPLALFHPAVAQWFRSTLGTPTDVQVDAWRAIRRGKHTLIAAPTGSGKTLAAFLCAIDDLVRESLLAGQLSDELRVLYISPLKALSNDIDKNLSQPLNGVRDVLSAQDGLTDIVIRSAVRTGDTSPSERDRIRRRPPHILVTTPESLFLMLTSDGGRQVLSTVRTVIVDEIHALISNKRGSHLALSLSRLTHLLRGDQSEAAAGSSDVLTRIGLSATQKPIERVAAYLAPDGDAAQCQIVDRGHVRTIDVALELTDSPLQAIMSNEVWTEVYDRLAMLIREHRTTIVFVNTRRLAERAARFLAERLGEDAVTAHHGSLARRHRLNAEHGLKSGRLRAVVATASLELGIDIGDVDLVCQLGSPHSIAQFLQRVGRSGHSVGRVPKGRLFPLSRDDLVQCAALLDAVREHELEMLEEPHQPLDVLAQQITATVSTGDFEEDALFELVRDSAHYRDLTRTQFDAVITMLSEGFSTRRGRRSAFLHRDAVNGRLRARRGARLTALTNGGAIPDQFDFDVVLEPAGIPIGTLNEDFAFESVPGDIFQLGNVSYRVLAVQGGKVRVEDANGQPPNIPFWFGEAPGRSDALSSSVSRLRITLQGKLEQSLPDTIDWLCTQWTMSRPAAEQLCDYLGASLAALGCLPNHSQIVFERFFDDVGDMHFVVHSPYGSRINRAWGLSLRKRFCRNFNFELQAAALEDAIVLSLGSTHSFVSADVARYLSANSVRDVLIQALLDVPMFETRWRWAANIALAVRRNRNGKKVPPQFQRSDAEDLIALVFPDQLACLENIAGPRQVPDHPLVEQTIEDCLTDVMDIVGLEGLLTRLAAGDIDVITRDLSEPSPLAQEVISAKPYAFLDEAPAEERRTLAISARRHMTPEKAADIGRLDQGAIEQVVSELRSTVRNADELHDCLVTQGVTTPDELDLLDPHRQFWAELAEQRRVCLVTLMQHDNHGVVRVVTAERLAEAQYLYPDATTEPSITPTGGPIQDDTSDPDSLRQAAVRELVRSRLEISGPVTARTLADILVVSDTQIDQALVTLESEGYAIRGSFTPDARTPHARFSAVSQRVEHSTDLNRSHAVELHTEQWCDRYVLARIHRRNVQSRRASVTAISIADYMRFQFDWHGLKHTQGALVKSTGHGLGRADGQTRLRQVVEQLQGWGAHVEAWTTHLLPARVPAFSIDDFEQLCLRGNVHWQRAYKRGSRRTPVPTTPVTFLCRQGIALSTAYPRRQPGANEPAANRLKKPRPSDQADNQLTDSLSSDAIELHAFFKHYGAAFYDELLDEAELPASRLWSALGELVAAGLLVADGLAALKALSLPARRRPSAERLMSQAGRFALCREPRRKRDDQDDSAGADAALEVCVDVLLARYGIVFRRLLEREFAWLPPWRQLLQVLRRREARGELHAGRIVDGVSGEQFALPEALDRLRACQAHHAKMRGVAEYLVVNASDCLNLVGILQPGQRIAPLTRNKLLFEDGICVAVQYGDDTDDGRHGARVEFLETIDPARSWLIRQHFETRENMQIKSNDQSRDKSSRPGNTDQQVAIR